MVNSKNVAFKVDKQTPMRWPPAQPYSTVINCRKPGGKRALKQAQADVSKPPEAPLMKVTRITKEDRKRERPDDVDGAEGASPGYPKKASRDFLSTFSSYPTVFAPHVSKPTKLRRGRPLQKNIDLDCWFTILRYSDPAQLLEMRDKIASCYRFLRDNPSLWKHSRSYHCHDLPEPTSELTEFQYSDLRHGHGCMSCGTSATRKTYWAFLRRWCKPCLHEKIIRESDALTHLKGTNGEDIAFISKCLPSGVIDSWGNFVGVGPAPNHSVKTVYLLSDVKNLVAEFVKESQDNYVSWHAEMRTWVANKAVVIEERRQFARKMELWEDTTRTSKSFSYQEKKDARKVYFLDKASKMTPPISARLADHCPSFKRAIAIPKDPSMASWLQLKPKLEKEAFELAKGIGLAAGMLHTSGGGERASTGTSTPNTDASIVLNLDPQGSAHTRLPFMLCPHARLDGA